MVKTRPIPDMYSLEIPSLNLVFNISPFQTVKHLKIVHDPYPVESDMVWIELINGTYGLFSKADLIQARKCPACGRDLDEPDQ